MSSMRQTCMEDWALWLQLQKNGVAENVALLYNMFMSNWNKVPPFLVDPLDTVKNQHPLIAQAIGMTLGSVGVRPGTDSAAASQAYDVIAGALAGVVLSITDPSSVEHVAQGQPIAVTTRLLLMLAQQELRDGWRVAREQSVRVEGDTPVETRADTTIYTQELGADFVLRFTGSVIETKEGELSLFAVDRLGGSSQGRLPDKVLPLPTNVPTKVVVQNGLQLPTRVFTNMPPGSPRYTETVTIRGELNPAEC